MVPGLGTRKSSQLIASFRTPQAIFRASKSELEAAGLSPSVAQSIASGCAFEDAADQQQKLAEAGAQLVTMTDSLYPPALLEIFDPPPMLFVRGQPELLASLMIAIVGTRRPTAYGTAVSARFARDLSGAGLTIASGMARGIDTAAHKAALEAGGGTVAVFGCGVDHIYPAENRKLAEQLIQRGLTVSEFPMGTPAYPQNFPVRNRIIAGMSAGVIIVEGGEYSGSSIKAKLAIEQGREVFAVPGNITSKMSWGPNLLIKQGAKLVQEWNDITNELPVAVRRELVTRAQQKLEPDLTLPLAEEPGTPLQALAKQLLSVLQVDVPQQLETLLATFEGVSSSELIGALFELEMSGLVRQLPGKNFVKVW